MIRESVNRSEISSALEFTFADLLKVHVILNFL